VGANAPDSTLWLVVALPLLLAGAVAAVFLLFEKHARAGRERPNRMRQVARQLGLRYYGSLEREALASLPRCSLLEGNVPLKVQNLMAERSRSPRLVLFDCQRAMSRDGRSSDEDSFTLHMVAMARAPGLTGLPALRIYREDLLGGPVGEKDTYRLKFAGDPEFGRRYWIAGASARQAALLLSGRVRRAIKAWTMKGPKPVVEVVDGWVAVHVESLPQDSSVGQRAAALLNYAGAIAASLEAGSREAAAQ